MFGRMCDSEQCVYHSWSLKPSLHGLFPCFLFFLPFFLFFLVLFLPPFLSFFWKSEKNDNFLTTNFFNVKYRIKSKSNHFFLKGNGRGTPGRCSWLRLGSWFWLRL